MTEVEALAVVVRRARKKLGLSQEEFAELCGIHRNYVGYIERAERKATIEVVFKIATALGISATSLVKRVEVEIGQS